MEYLENSVGRNLKKYKKINVDFFSLLFFILKISIISLKIGLAARFTYLGASVSIIAGFHLNIVSIDVLTIATPGHSKHKTK